ncbi:MAG: hypothetical protein ACLS95_05085 [Clostridia bacterium]
MINLIYHILFLLFTIYVLIHTISYGIYEIKEENNKTGGYFVISFTVFTIIFSNIVVWLN